MATPRYKLVDATTPMHYHLVSRCVRASWLLGTNPITRRKYDHRKRWIIKRLFELARYFSVEVMAYTVMSNHYHLVVHYDPTGSERWSDEEVAFRWVEVHPPRKRRNDEAAKARLRNRLLEDRERLAYARKHLSDLSTFMKRLNQYISTRANREDGCRGHFFEERFYSGALLDESAVVAAMAYVDLNPVRAKIARHIKDIRDTSVAERLEAAKNTPERLRVAVEPLVSGLGESGARLDLSLDDYLTILKDVAAAIPVGGTVSHDSKSRRWIQHMATIGKHQRAYGSLENLKAWTDARGMRLREVALAS